jgi:hypothetical protein
MSAQDNLSQNQFNGPIEGPEQRVTDKKGKVKYYANYHTAMNAAARRNEKEGFGRQGNWLFEGDENGWYVHKDLNS